MFTGMPRQMMSMTPQQQAMMQQRMAMMRGMRPGMMQPGKVLTLSYSVGSPLTKLCHAHQMIYIIRLNHKLITQ